MSMTTGTVTSVFALATVALGAIFVVRLIGKQFQTSSRARYAFVALLWVAAFLSIWFVDTNVPLSESHYRPGGEAAPTWATILALFFRFAAFASLTVVSSKQPTQSSEEPHRPQ